MSKALRDTRRSREYWENMHDRYFKLDSSSPSYFDDVQERLQTSDTIQPVYGLFSYCSNCMEQINFCYSKGDALDETRATYVIPGLGRYRQLIGEIERLRGQMDTEHFYDYLPKPNVSHSAYTLLSW